MVDNAATKSREKYVRIAEEHGVRPGLARIIIDEARRMDVPVSLAFGLVECESNFKKVYGHDGVRNPVKSPPGGLLEVTPDNYAEYLEYRNKGWGNQGVGEAQLTSPGFQDKADRLGGCWKAQPNVRVAMELLGYLIDKYGVELGLAAYNAGEGGMRQGKGRAYSTKVQNAGDKWHDRFTA